MQEKFLKFREKVQPMTAKEIILAMIDGLKNPVMKVDLDTYGSISEGVCYGCAATNMICRLGDVELEEDLNKIAKAGSPAIATRDSFIDVFEEAVNELRLGNIHGYNSLALEEGFAQIIFPHWWLGLSYGIYNHNYQDPEVLQKFIDLANYQDA